MENKGEDAVEFKSLISFKCASTSSLSKLYSRTEKKQVLRSDTVNVFFWTSFALPWSL